MKRQPPVGERTQRGLAAMNPGAGSGRTSIVSPEPRPLLELKEAGGVGGFARIELGPEPLFAALAAGPDYSWTTVAGLSALAVVYRFQVSSSSSINWAVRVTAEPDGAGELMFEAVGIGDTVYQCSWPWLYDTGGATDLHIGIRNIAGAPSNFTLAELRALG